MKPHFFILGNPRSGTTMFRLMMNSHPFISVPPECGFAEWHYEQFKDWDISKSIDDDALAEFINRLSGSKKIETWRLDYDFLYSQIKESNPSSYAELCELVYLSYAAKRQKSVKVWGDKNNYYIKKLTKINAIFPNSKFIKIIRDGRDVACSYIDMKNVKSDSAYKPILTDNIAEIANEWLSNNQVIDDFLKTIESRRSLTIRYEDLLTNTSGTLKYVTDFLEVVFDSKMLEYYRNESDLEPAELMAWKMKTQQAPDVSNMNKYIGVLSNNDIQTFSQIAGDYLGKYGYS
ncbi:MAG: sulfotransferase [Bacteroidetes bacterium]|nr:sulfotransferase [Bacteroidota bacterium]